MSSKPRSKTPSLFAAAGLDRTAPRPLADKLRPDKLSEVVGQDHLLGPDGALHRTLACPRRAPSARLFFGVHRAPAKPRWRCFLPTPPNSISSRFRRFSPALP